MSIRILLTQTLILSALLVLSACSSLNKKEVPKVKVPPLTIEEKERLRAIETYRQMRLKALERAKHRQKHFTKKRKRKRLQQRKKIITVIPTPVPTPSYPKKDPQEIMIEVEQNLTFFCMKHRKSSRFREENSCQLFTQEKLKECQDIHLETDNARLISCVKSRLRL